MLFALTVTLVAALANADVVAFVRTLYVPALRPVTSVDVIAVHVDAVDDLYSIAVVTPVIFSMPPAGVDGATGLAGILRLCASLSTVVVPSPFFTIGTVVPSHAVWIAQVVPDSVTAVPLTVYVPPLTNPVSVSAV